MTSRPDLEAFSSAFVDRFAGRAIEVAEGQREQAGGIVQERWQQVIDMIEALASIAV
jgi:hypothetical protein